MPLSVLLHWKAGFKGRLPACLLLHLDGKAEALKHPLAAALIDKGVTVVAPDLRATGEAKMANDVVHGAPDQHQQRTGGVGRPAAAGAMDIRHPLFARLDGGATGAASRTLFRGRHRPCRRGRPVHAANADDE